MYTMFKVIMQKHVIHDTSFWKSGMQNIVLFKIDWTIRYFQALLCFYTRIFQTSSNQGV